MANDPIEELYITIRADTGEFLIETKKGVEQAKKELKDFEQAGKKAFQDTAAAGEKLDGLVRDVNGRLRDSHGRFVKMGEGAKQGFGEGSKAAQSFQGTIEKLKAAFTALAGIIASIKIVQFFVGLAKGAVEANAQFETYRTQFETLLGSAEAARTRIQELAQFGIETPFELPEIVEASRVLQTFGGTALATGENLRMIGDIAAGVNQPFKDVAFWIGRMYDALQSGRPWGEAGMRLQEMGAMSGQARAELESLQKSGASGEEIWQRFNELVGARFTGNMERLASTLQGIISNLNDFRDNLIRIGGEAVFEETRENAQRLLEIISAPEMRKAFENMAKALGEAAARMEDLLTSGAIAALEDLDPKAVNDLAEAMRDLTSAIGEFVEQDIDTDVNGVIEGLTTVTDLTTALVNDFNNIKSVLDPISPIIKEIRDVILSVLFPATALYDALKSVGGIVNQLSGKDMTDYSRALAESTETEKQAAAAAREHALAMEAAAKARFSGFDGQGKPEEPTTTETQPTEDEVSKRLQEVGSELLDIQEETNQELEANEQEHAVNMAEIDTEYVNTRLELGAEMTDNLEELEKDVAERRAEILENSADELTDLEAETTQRRAEIFEQAKADLADLEVSTDKSIEDERASFNEKETRDLEDHMARLRDIRSSYLNSLEEAVASRDARQIVQLQKQYREQQAKENEQYETGRDRAQEDQSQRLAEIEANEQERADKIIQARERELAKLAEQEESKRQDALEKQREQLLDLDVYESERRQKIEDGFTEDIAKLDKSTAIAKAKETQAFNERQAELESALTKRLEAEANALAESDKINDEGAQKILETLAKYFGEEGEIDNLLSEFRKRTTQKMKLQIEFEGGASETGSGAGGTAAGGGNLNVPQRSFAAGGSMFANRPTLVQFGEVPELATFTPLSQINNTNRTEGDFRVKVDFTGVPSNIDQGGMEEVAAKVLVQALRQAGMR